MNKDEVPQDAIRSYGGRRRLLYATDRDGSYVTVQSSGWEPEGEATAVALDELARAANDAWHRARAGATSPLEYYMWLRRMDVPLLSQSSGIARWRIRRHFRPEVYSRLPDRVLKRYAEALGISNAAMRNLVERP